MIILYHESFTSISNTANFCHKSSPSPPFSFTFSTSIFLHLQWEQKYPFNQNIFETLKLPAWRLHSRLKKLKGFLLAIQKLMITSLYILVVQICSYSFVIVLWQKNLKRHIFFKCAVCTFLIALFFSIFSPFVD